MQAPDNFIDSFDWLHTTASEQTGLSDFGPSDYETGLRILLDAMDRDCTFSKQGRDFTLTHLIGVLKSRLYSEEGWKRNPGYRNVDIRPLVITALPRSGTSALHRLLAVDSQFQGIQRWLAAAPMVRPPIAEWNSNPAFRASKTETDRFNQQSPEFAAAHEEAAHAVEECMEVLQQSFISNMFASRFPTPTYTKWLLKSSEANSYRRYANVLRLIGLADQDKRWLLKNPGHTWHLDNLFEVFPHALVIQTHRDPAEAMTSICSVLHMLHSVTVGRENSHPEQLGSVEVAKWKRAMDLTRAARASRPDRFFDVDFLEFRAAPMRVVASIYERFDLELTKAVAEKMQEWLLLQPPQQKSGHHYVPETFGLTSQGIRDSFAEYIGTHGL